MIPLQKSIRVPLDLIENDYHLVFIDEIGSLLHNKRSKLYAKPIVQLIKFIDCHLESDTYGITEGVFLFPEIKLIVIHIFYLLHR